MYLELFKALKSLNIDDQRATDTVQAMNAHIDTRISQATAPLLQKLDSVKSELAAKIDAYALVKNAQASELAAKIDAYAQVKNAQDSELAAKVDAYAHVKNAQDSDRERRSSRLRWVIGTGITAVGATLGALKLVGLL